MPPFASTILTHLLAAIVAGAGSFYVAWEMQAGNVTKVELANAKAVLAASERANTLWSGIVNRALVEQQAAIGREADTRRRLDSSRSELVGLRRDLDDATARLAFASPAACIDRAAALSSVLSQCAGAFEDLAGKAERHTNDIQTLIGAWPRTP